MLQVRTGLDLAVEGTFEEKRQIHLESSCILDHLGIDQDLVRNAEVEGELILVHELAVLLGSFAAHLGIGCVLCLSDVEGVSNVREQSKASRLTEAMRVGRKWFRWYKNSRRARAKDLELWLPVVAEV